MMMPLHLRIVCVLVPILFVVVFVWQTFYTEPRRYGRSPSDQITRSLKFGPAFQLFPPNAAISLTEDNNTYFPARPAAFGPELSQDGLSAALWIGAGFGEDDIEPQGELGCSDVPGWDGRRAADGMPILPTDKNLDDGTDDYLEDFATGSYYRQHRKTPPAARAKALAADASDSDADPAAPLRKVLQTLTATAAGTATGASATTGGVNHLALAPVAGGGEASRHGNIHGNIQSLQEGAEIAGKIVLLRRGGCGFLAKVMWAQRRGAVAVIVGDDRKGGPLIQMYASGDASAVEIPSVFAAHVTAHLLTAMAASAMQGDDVMGVNSLAKTSLAGKGKNKSKDDAEKAQAAQAAQADAEAAQKTDALSTSADATSSSRRSWLFWRKSKTPREWVLDEYVPSTESSTLSGLRSGAVLAARTEATGDDGDGGDGTSSRQLFVTITPTGGHLLLMDTVLVLVASPLLALVTITIVLLFLRLQQRQRAWWAPKELVDQLPVHVYFPPGSPPPNPIMVPAGSGVASPMSSRPTTPTMETINPSVTTPLLQREQRPRSRTTTGIPSDARRSLIPGPVQPSPPSRFLQFECVVCLEDYVYGDLVMRLPCGHEFHAACITPWLTTRSRSCPICKADVVDALLGEGA